MSFRIQPELTRDDIRELKVLFRLGNFGPPSILADAPGRERIGEIVDMVLEWAVQNTSPSWYEPYDGVDGKAKLNAYVANDYLSRYGTSDVARLLHGGVKHWKEGFRPSTVEFVEYVIEPKVPDHYAKAVMKEAFRTTRDPREVRLEWYKQEQTAAIRLLSTGVRYRRTQLALDAEALSNDSALATLSRAAGIGPEEALRHARVILQQRRGLNGRGSGT